MILNYVLAQIWLWHTAGKCNFWMYLKQICSLSSQWVHFNYWNNVSNINWLYKTHKNCYCPPARSIVSI